MTGDGLAREMTYALIRGVNSDRSLVILACWISAKLAGWKGDPEPDAVEWFGRLLFVATCVITIGYQFAAPFLP